MLRRRLRRLALATTVVGASALSCAQLIGLDELGNDSGIGGAAGSSSGGTGSNWGGQGSGGEASTGGAGGSGGTLGNEAGSGGEMASGGSLGGGGSDGSGGQTSGGASSGGADGSGGSGPDCTFDEFDDPAHTAACWSTYGESFLAADYSIDEDESVLVLRPDAGEAWFNGDSAFLLYQAITGDFLLETQVWTLDAVQSDPETLPSVRFAEGGLLAFPAHQPLDGPVAPFRGYYAIKAGTLLDEGAAGYKGEHTSAEEMPTSINQVADMSAWQGASLRMCRVGDVLLTGYLPEGGTTWTGLHSNDQSLGYDTRDAGLSPLTETMYVGLIGEIWDTQVDDGAARIVYSQAEFSVPDDLDDCWN